MNQTGDKRVPGKKERDLVTFRNVRLSWITFIIVTIAFTIAFRMAWWIIFPIVGTLSAAIQKTSAYYKLNAKCPGCQAILDEGDTFCRKCGAQVISVCPKCNSTVKSGEFCPTCGTSGPSDQPFQAVSSQVRVQGRKFCPGCGTEIVENVKICPTCGYSM